MKMIILYYNVSYVNLADHVKDKMKGKMYGGLRISHSPRSVKKIKGKNGFDKNYYISG